MFVPQSAVFDVMQALNYSLISSEDSADTPSSTFYRGFSSYVSRILTDSTLKLPYYFSFFSLYFMGWLCGTDGLTLERGYGIIGQVCLPTVVLFSCITPL